MSSPHRQERLEEAVRDALAEILHSEVKDPRMPMMLTVRHVRLTKDMRQARVYFTQMPDDEAAVEATLDALDSATGYIRSRLGDHVRMRYLPELAFHFDDSAGQADRIEQLLREARPASDNE